MGCSPAVGPCGGQGGLGGGDSARARMRRAPGSLAARLICAYNAYPTVWWWPFTHLSATLSLAASRKASAAGVNSRAMTRSSRLQAGPSWRWCLSLMRRPTSAR